MFSCLTNDEILVCLKYWLEGISRVQSSQLRDVLDARENF